MSRVLLVGKGAPDRGGIPTFLDTCAPVTWPERHQVTFLNVAHMARPKGGRRPAGNVAEPSGTPRGLAEGRGQDIVHIHSALAPAVTVIRAGLLALAARAAGVWRDRARPRRQHRDLADRPAQPPMMRPGHGPAHRVVAVLVRGGAGAGPGTLGRVG